MYMYMYIYTCTCNTYCTCTCIIIYTCTCNTYCTCTWRGTYTCTYRGTYTCTCTHSVYVLWVFSKNTHIHCMIKGGKDEEYIYCTLFLIEVIISSYNLFHLLLFCIYMYMYT